MWKFTQLDDCYSDFDPLSTVPLFKRCTLIFSSVSTLTSPSAPTQSFCSLVFSLSTAPIESDIFLLARSRCSNSMLFSHLSQTNESDLFFSWAYHPVSWLMFLLQFLISSAHAPPTVCKSIIDTIFTCRWKSLIEQRYKGDTDSKNTDVLFRWSIYMKLCLYRGQLSSPLFFCCTGTLLSEQLDDAGFHRFLTRRRLNKLQGWCRSH